MKQKKNSSCAEAIFRMAGALAVPSKFLSEQEAWGQVYCLILTESSQVGLHQ